MELYDRELKGLSSIHKNGNYALKKDNDGFQLMSNWNLTIWTQVLGIQMIVKTMTITFKN